MGSSTVAVLIAEDADGAGEDDALEARQTGGFEEIGHADDIHAGGVEQIAALGREQRRHVVAEGDDALDAVVENSRHDFFQIRHVALDERHAGHAPLRGRGHKVECDDVRAFGRQVLYDVAADVAAAADNHDFHAASKPVTLRDLYDDVADRSNIERHCLIRERFVI